MLCQEVSGTDRSRCMAAPKVCFPVGRSRNGDPAAGKAVLLAVLPERGLWQPGPRARAALLPAGSADRRSRPRRPLTRRVSGWRSGPPAVFWGAPFDPAAGEEHGCWCCRCRCLPCPFPPGEGGMSWPPPSCQEPRENGAHCGPASSRAGASAVLTGAGPAGPQPLPLRALRALLLRCGGGRSGCVLGTPWRA